MADKGALPDIAWLVAAKAFRLVKAAVARSCWRPAPCRQSASSCLSHQRRANAPEVPNRTSEQAEQRHLGARSDGAGLHHQQRTHAEPDAQNGQQQDRTLPDAT